VRAKILYAAIPADANKFRHLADPLAMAILGLKVTLTLTLTLTNRNPNPNPHPLAMAVLGLKVCPVLGINVLFFILVFLLIDRTDESQLVRYETQPQP
jgi:hypothetical protein